MTDVDYAMQAERPPPRDPFRPMIWGVGLIAFTVIGLGGWSSVARVDSAALATGTIAVESNRRTIQHLEGGIVQEILVREGSVVREGDVLIRLDPTRTRAQATIFQSEFDAQTAIAARLNAERESRRQIEFPSGLLARTSDPSVREIVETQRSLFEARMAALLGQRSILEQRVQQIAEQISGLRALERSKREQTRLIQEELRSLEGLLADAIVTRTRVLALQREASRLEGEIGEHVAAIARSQQAVGETRLQILQLERQRQEEIATQLRDTQSRIFQLREQLATADDAQRRIEIVAPIDGTVLNLQVFTTGGVIAPGAPIMNIVPSNDRFIVEAQIAPTEIDTVRPGLDVTLRFSTVGSRLVPTIRGTLEDISPDRLTDQRTGLSFYMGRIHIPPEEANRLAGLLNLHAGMPVEVMINRGDRTILQYLIEPLRQTVTRSLREV